MLCTTTREGSECAFMGKSGCTYNGGTCQPAIEPCLGCDRSVNVNDMVYCQKFPDPAAKWRYGVCNMATHMKQDEKIEAKTNPLKASKRAARGR